jgi:hypothetical protein
MTASDSTEQTKQQDATKEPAKKPVEVKDEDLVCRTIASRLAMSESHFALSLSRLVRRR